MIDIHNHLLPGIDDGAADMAMALAMLEQMVAQGVSQVFCTPHLSFRRLGDVDQVIAYVKQCDQGFQQLQAEAVRTGLAITLHTGFELALDADFFEILEQLPDPQALGLARSSYFLIEITSSYLLNIQTLENYLYRFAAAGLTPIMAHPEWTLQTVSDKFIEVIIRWVRQGRLMLQLNASSIIELGRWLDMPFSHGYRRRCLTRRFLKENLVYFIASDAHDTCKRPPDLLQARNYLNKRYEPRLTQALFHDHAIQLASGQTVISQKQL